MKVLISQYKSSWSLSVSIRDLDALNEILFTFNYLNVSQFGMGTHKYHIRDCL